MVRPCLRDFRWILYVFFIYFRYERVTCSCQLRSARITIFFFTWMKLLRYFHQAVFLFLSCTAKRIDSHHTHPISLLSCPKNSNMAMSICQGIPAQKGIGITIPQKKREVTFFFMPNNATFSLNIAVGLLCA